jgi:hypothetical protein
MFTVLSLDWAIPSSSSTVSASYGNSGGQSRESPLNAMGLLEQPIAADKVQKSPSNGCGHVRSSEGLQRLFDGCTRKATPRAEESGPAEKWVSSFGFIAKHTGFWLFCH